MDDDAFIGLDASATERLRAALAAHPRGLFTDVDGTISALAPTPEDAVLLPGVRELLERARDSFEVVAAVSGRAAGDARRMVGARGILYIGNHGLERIAPDWSAYGDPTLHVAPAAAPYAAAISAILTALERDLAPRFPGLRIEPKGVTASIHVRNTPVPAVAEGETFQAAMALAAPHGLRVTRGKRVVELRPPVEIDKGVAVEETIRAAGLRAALYLGDDRTDIDAFRALHRLTAEGACQGVAVAVLHPEAPADLADAADITLDSIERVPAFLRWLVEQD
jgi:trehalose 6-phosphate phosphatase